MACQIIKKIFFIGLTALLFNGCSSPAKKDLYLRSRLPSAELPTFNRKTNSGINVGATVDIETERLTVKATRNLVSDFDFYKDNATYQKGSPLIAGADVTGTISSEFLIPLQLGMMTDQLEIKAGLLGFKENPSNNWFMMIDGAYYKTAAYNDSGGCKSIICFETNSEKRKAEEDSITTEHKGSEFKSGLTIGKYLAPAHALFAAYHKMDYTYDLYASRLTGTPLEIRSQYSFSAEGYALGYLYHVTPPTLGTATFGVTMGLTAEKIIVNWFSDRLETMLFGFRLNLSL